MKTNYFIKIIKPFIKPFIKPYEKTLNLFKNVYYFTRAHMLLARINTYEVVYDIEVSHLDCFFDIFEDRITDIEISEFDLLDIENKLQNKKIKLSQKFYDNTYTTIKNFLDNFSILKKEEGKTEDYGPLSNGILNYLEIYNPKFKKLVFSNEIYFFEDYEHIYNFLNGEKKNRPSKIYKGVLLKEKNKVIVRGLTSYDFFVEEKDILYEYDNYIYFNYFFSLTSYIKIHDKIIIMNDLKEIGYSTNDIFIISKKNVVLNRKNDTYNKDITEPTDLYKPIHFE